MMQPLHFTPKAIADLSVIPWINAPACAAATRYLLDKLRQAQVFVLTDHGELLDRGKPYPEVPGVMFRPPFPVVALEYTADAQRRTDPFYTAARSSRRIALAWDWRDDLPPGLKPPIALGPGVMVASIAFMDDIGRWLPMSGACHFEYDGEWQQRPATVSGFAAKMIETGAVSAAAARAREYPGTAVPLLYEGLLAAKRTLGSVDAVMDTVAADVNDEVNAYFDLCYALACRNVEVRERAAPAALNKQRIKKGKLPLLGFRVLELANGGAMPGAGVGARAGGAMRSHLRRGHIRRLSGDRVTWVNSTVVRGRGFLDKVYAA